MVRGDIPEDAPFLYVVEIPSQPALSALRGNEECITFHCNQGGTASSRP